MSGSRAVLHALSCMAAALLLSLFFHSPRWWAFSAPMPGSTYWDRGLQFMAQCEAPFSVALTDAALVWRLAPAVTANLLGLHGTAALVVPWSGLLVMLYLCAAISLRRTGDRELALLTTTLVATTTATLTVTGWLGMNDAWYASALLAIAFQPQRAAVIAACLLGPWIDERFLLALPLALLVRHLAMVEGMTLRNAAMIGTAGAGVYIVTRLTNALALPGQSLDAYWNYVLSDFPKWLAWAPLGLVMGLRAAWFPIATLVTGRSALANPQARWAVVAAATAPVLVITVLASDTGRASTMLLPLVLLGVERFTQSEGRDHARICGRWLVAANLLLPAMHVTYQSGDLINSLPVELARLFAR